MSGEMAMTKIAATIYTTVIQLRHATHLIVSFALNDTNITIQKPNLLNIYLVNINRWFKCILKSSIKSHVNTIS